MKKGVILNVNSPVESHNKAAEAFNSKYGGHTFVSPLQRARLEFIHMKEKEELKKAHRRSSVMRKRSMQVQVLNENDEISKELLRLCSDKGLNEDVSRHKEQLNTLMQVLRCTALPGEKAGPSFEAGNNLPAIVHASKYHNESDMIYDYSKVKKSDTGTTLLMFAAFYGRVDIVNVLISMYHSEDNSYDLSAYVNQRNSSDGRTALHNAAASGSVEVINLLLSSYGGFADKDITDNAGYTPSAYARNKGHVDCAVALESSKETLERMMVDAFRDKHGHECDAGVIELDYQVLSQFINNKIEEGIEREVSKALKRLLLDVDGDKQESSDGLVYKGKPKNYLFQIILMLITCLFAYQLRHQLFEMMKPR